jgi:virginiamycin B lyase
MASDRRMLTSLAALALLAVFLLPVAMAQGTPVIDEFKLPNGTTSIDAMCLDSNGNVWLARSSPATLYKFDPSTGAFQSHEVPAEKDAMIKGMSAEGSDYIWIADQSGQKIYGYDVGKNKFYNFTFPVKLDPSAVIAQDHYLWVACNMELGRLDIDTNFLKDYYVDKYTADLADLALDRMGNVWFVEYSSGKVGGYYRLDDQLQIFPIPTADAAPTCLGIDPQGRLWFIESGPNKLGMFDTGMSSFKELDLPPIDGMNVTPKRIAVDGDGNIWLSDMAHNRIIKYYPSKGAFVPISLNGSKIYPTFIEADGTTIWIIESGIGALARIQADSLYGLNPTPTPTVRPTEQSATPTPKPTPGFELLAAMAAMAVALTLSSRNN